MGNVPCSPNNKKNNNTINEHSGDHKKTSKMISVPEYKSDSACELFKHIYNREWSNVVKSEYLYPLVKAHGAKLTCNILFAKNK